MEILRKPTLEEAERLLEEGGTEMALRILTQDGYLAWSGGFLLKETDIREYPRLD